MATSNNLQSREPPNLNIPTSLSAVRVSVIDTTTRISGIPAEVTVVPRIGAFRTMNCPALSFLIEHDGTGQKLLYDLGVPRDWEHAFPSPVVQKLKENHWQIEVKSNVSEILRAQGVDSADVDAIIWSHWHWDHVGDPSTFPHSTTLIVGPGFKDEFIPGWPTNPDSRVHESAFAGRAVREVRFDPGPNSLMLGDFKAYDYFGDGSFYLIDSPGHAIGHLCALARTSTEESPTFIFMGGDACHHGGEFRPTEYLPLPRQVAPDPLRDISNARFNSCPGEIFLNLHPNKSSTSPFLHPSGGHDLDECKATIRKLQTFDAHENIFCIMAHDQPLMDILEFYPSNANEWKAKGWREISMWRFLGDFVEEGEKTRLAK